MTWKSHRLRQWCSSMSAYDWVNHTCLLWASVPLTGKFGLDKFLVSFQLQVWALFTISGYVIVLSIYWTPNMSATVWSARNIKKELNSSSIIAHPPQELRIKHCGNNETWRKSLWAGLPALHPGNPTGLWVQGRLCEAGKCGLWVTWICAWTRLYHLL